MDEKKVLTKSWIKTGFICGFISFTIYPLLLIVSLPMQPTVALACGFGILLSIASIGLYHFLKLNSSSVSLKIGVIFNVIGCSIVTEMFLVQFAIYDNLKNKIASETGALRESGDLIWKGVNSVQLGLDVAWDVYMALGSLLIAVNMWRHPRFGKIFSISGILITLAILILNISTFPIPPAESSLIDLGPLFGLWFLIVTVQIARSFKWVDEKLGIV